MNYRLTKFIFWEISFLSDYCHLKYSAPPVSYFVNAQKLKSDFGCQFKCVNGNQIKQNKRRQHRSTVMAAQTVLIFMCILFIWQKTEQNSNIVSTK